MMSQTIEATKFTGQKKIYTLYNLFFDTNVQGAPEGFHSEKTTLFRKASPASA